MPASEKAARGKHVAGFVADRLRDQGLEVLILDGGIRGESPVPVAVTRQEVARAGAPGNGRLQSLAAADIDSDGDGLLDGQEDTNREVWTALRTLPTEQSEVVVLKIWEEMTFAQIANILEISSSTAACSIEEFPANSSWPSRSRR